MSRERIEQSLVDRVEDSRDEMVELARALVRVPTVNPPGELYRECARLLGDRLIDLGFEVEYLEATEHAEHTEQHPRVNVLGIAGSGKRPRVHLNGHLDVVPPGDGWTLDPFSAEIRDDRLYGRGSADMKCGLAAAVMAAACVLRSDALGSGSIEISGTADEESGGFAGVGFLAEIGRLSSQRTDHVIIPEPFGPDRICVGHRGVSWLEVTTRGRIAHGSMPFLGASAIEAMAAVLERLRNELLPALASRETAMPVVPPEAGAATLNINAISGGQSEQEIQTPCIADRCRAILDRRFLIEEDSASVRAELVETIEGALAAHPEWGYEIEQLMLVEPVMTPPQDRLIGELEGAIERVLGRKAKRVASPGTYDHKHVTRIGGITSCVAYGPGVLEQAHQPDEWCGLDDMVDSAKVMALTIARLVRAD